MANKRKKLMLVSYTPYDWPQYCEVLDQLLGRHGVEIQKESITEFQGKDMNVDVVLVSIVAGLDQHIVAMAVLTFFFLTNLMGTKSAALVNKVMTACLIGGLLLFIVFGIGKVDFGYVFDPKHLFANGAPAFISTMALLSSATTGAHVIAELGGETKDAGRVIPRVMITATLGTGVFYVLISLVAAGVLPMEVTADQPLTLVAMETMPTVAFYIFVIGAALGATATTLNATLSWVTKPLLVACDDGILPRELGHRKQARCAL